MINTLSAAWISSCVVDAPIVCKNCNIIFFNSVELFHAPVVIGLLMASASDEIFRRTKPKGIL